jgi:catechol 2,3-dioxygenase-like lactoylglutathione lyase family enzyme
MMEDFYPMPMFINLEVADLPASVDWYQRALGFRVVFEGPPGGPSMAHLRRDRYQDLLLFPAPSEGLRQPGGGVTLQFQAGAAAVEEIARQARAAGTERVEGPVTRPWNVRDVTVYDLDGYRLRFSEPIDMGKGFDEVMAEAVDGE